MGCGWEKSRQVAGTPDIGFVTIESSEIKEPLRVGNITHHYQFGKLIGNGKYGVVR
jgi:hypothetical protein